MIITKKKSKCPICKKPTEDKFKPFCSFRCKQIDLSNWLNENYTIPTDEYPIDEYNNIDNKDK